MLLKDYFPNIDKKISNIFFSGISFNSSKVKKNDIFFAIKGNKTDGNKFIPFVIKRGCKIIVSERKSKKFQDKIHFIYTKNIRKLLAEVAFKIFKKRPRNLVAITGTNGKSSIADFYYQILDLNKKSVASIGTLGVKSKKLKMNLSNTTVDPIKLGKILKKLKDFKIENVVMEASSHGLKQNRLDGLKFNSSIFTNLSQDHLDYHKNLNAYLRAKLYLFENLVKKRGNVITDEKIPEFKKIKKITIEKNLIINTLSDKKNKFEIISHNFKGNSQQLKIKFNNSIKNIELNLIGKIQIKNVLMAIIAAKKSKVSIDNILKVIPKLKPVEGRFEIIGKIKNKSKVVLDYAHTPEALKTCIVNLREQFPNKKINILFGCGGNRDQNKRSKMGYIAHKYSDDIYLTNDNPRNENPSKIRKDIKRGIKRDNVIEISNRAKAIREAIKNLCTGEILLVAGKGHENIQEIGKKKIFFSDKKIILDAIKVKNFDLSNNLKLNILKELSRYRKIPSSTYFNSARINSKEVKKNDIFFAIKGKKNDGNKFVKQSLKKGASIAIVNRIQGNLDIKRQIKVKNTLKFLTNISKIFRNNISTKIIAITGSCGKTTLKELLSSSLKKVSKVGMSPKSYNNKFGVPLSLLNLNQNDNYGVLEIGMDKKGEIDYLSSIIKPDISVITNINYAHAKNFKNIKHIALAKSEIINNTNPDGFVVLNADDKFYKFHQKIALDKNLNVISFGIKNSNADIRFLNIKKSGKNFKIDLKVRSFKVYFFISNDFTSNIYNILATISVMNIYINVSKLNKNIFLNFKTPPGRGNFFKIKMNKKIINLIDESYNSNPLSLKTAVLNYEKIETKKSKKYLLLGDMLELGNHSKKLHEAIAPIINKAKVDKIYVKGNRARLIFNKLSKSKKGRVLFNNNQIIEMIKNDLNNDDYLMIKASNATGFNKIVRDIKGFN